MSGRLIIAIISTAAEEAAILIVGVWLLPKAGIKIPFLLIIGVMIIWFGWTVFTYRMGTRALITKPVNGLSSMKGMKGIVVKALEPDGIVQINGELWKSTSVSGGIGVGIKVTVVRQEGLKLLVSADVHNLSTSSPVDNGDNKQRNANDTQHQIEDF